MNGKLIEFIPLLLMLMMPIGGLILLHFHDKNLDNKYGDRKERRREVAQNLSNAWRKANQDPEFVQIKNTLLNTVVYGVAQRVQIHLDTDLLRRQKEFYDLQHEISAKLLQNGRSLAEIDKIRAETYQILASVQDNEKKDRYMDQQIRKLEQEARKLGFEADLAQQSAREEEARVDSEINRRKNAKR